MEGIELDIRDGVINRGHHVESETAVLDPSAQEFSLPPADGGRQAWMFLAACFVVEALVWGFPFSFGVFQEYYSTHEPFVSDPHGIAAVGTTATGIMYMLGLLLFPAYKQWNGLAHHSKWAGLPLMSVALIAASFATQVKHLVLAQGVLYALGGCIIYYPTLVFLDEWFIARKGLAFGVMWAGTGAAGLVIPFVLNFLLEKFGFRTTLRIWAVTLIILASPLIYFLRPRLPVSRSSQAPRYGLNFLSTSSFWLFLLGLTAESSGYFIPSIYLPTFASSLGFSQSIGTLLLALINAAGVFSNIAFGLMIDRFHVTTVALISTVGATASVFLLWGLSTALPSLVVFALIYGFFAGGFISTNAGIIKVIKQRDETADIGTVIGLLSAGRGVGALVCGPLSEALLKGGSWQGEAGAAYGSQFGSLIVFTGVTTAVGGVSFLGKVMSWM